MSQPARQSEAGLSLVEMLVALVLFALVGLASFAMLDAIIKARDRTEGRLAAMAQVDRTLTLFSRDLGQSLQGRSLVDGQLEFSLYEDGAVIEMRYFVQDGALIRRVQTDTMTDPLDQTLMGGIASARWRLLDAAGNWAETWPPPGPDNIGEGGPRAAEMQLTLAGSGLLSGTLRRVVELPRDAAR